MKLFVAIADCISQGLAISITSEGLYLFYTSSSWTAQMFVYECTLFVREVNLAVHLMCPMRAMVHVIYHTIYKYSDVYYVCSEV